MFKHPSSVKDKKYLPTTKTNAPMKTAWKTFPDASATSSMKNADKPAQSVPSPLFSPLQRVAPDICSKENHTVLIDH